MSAATNIALQLDDELHWIVSETMANMFQSAETVKRGKMCTEIGRVVGAVLVERFQAKGFTKLRIEEFALLGNRVIDGMSEATLTAGSYEVARHVAEACATYAECRFMGMESSYPEPKSRSLVSDYDPFNNEGGFCNPIKLGMLHED